MNFAASRAVARAGSEVIIFDINGFKDMVFSLLSEFIVYKIIISDGEILSIVYFYALLCFVSYFFL
jgi:hypothetical protein